MLLAKRRCLSEEAQKHEIFPPRRRASAWKNGKRGGRGTGGGVSTIRGGGEGGEGGEGTSGRRDRERVKADNG